MFSPSQHQLRSREAPLLISHNGYRVVKVSDHFVVKYGRADQVDLLEELNVQQATKVKVPRVYALYNEPESSTNYVVKEYIKEGILMNYATSSHQGTLEVLGNAIFCMVYSGPHSRHLPSMVPSTSEAALNEAPALKYLATADTRTTYPRPQPNVFVCGLSAQEHHSYLDGFPATQIQIPTNTK
ncbi:hypothetical protein BDFG_03137 [Blastomyces dermatitidis ATCC 26199]|nr:hypothetical protein BDFG_03137 [Blastomyces dermatitidis ATCC 26199]